MARITGSKCKQCRQMGEKLFLRGERCFGAKCALVKKAYRPGAHGNTGKRRRAVSEFGRQLLQKQKIKKYYGVLERQFRKYFDQAQTKKGDTRENLMRTLEIRLDNVVYRLGLSKSRLAARQLVNHGHVLVNGKRVSIPSYQVRAGETITLHEKIKKSPLMENLLESVKKHEEPAWLTLNKETLEAKVVTAPTIDDLGDLVPIGLIVEFYSR